MTAAAQVRRVHAVSNRRRLAPDARSRREELDALARWLDAIVGAAVDVVHLRERDLEARELMAVARGAAASVREQRVQLVINDRVDVALACGAAGVHLRADGLPIARVRSIAPPGWIIGRSTHSEAEVSQATDADYVYFGTVFPSASKPALPHPAGLDALASAAAAARVPVIAIGGVDPTNAAACVAAGASGVAAIGWFVPPPGADAASVLAERVIALRNALSTSTRTRHAT